MVGSVSASAKNDGPVGEPGKLGVMSMGVSPTFFASNTRESGMGFCTKLLVVVLPEPWVPLIQMITDATDPVRQDDTGVAAPVIRGCLGSQGGPRQRSADPGSR